MEATDDGDWFSTKWSNASRAGEEGGVEEDEQEQGEEEEEGGGSGGAGWVVGSLDGWLEGQETGGGMPGSEAFKVAKLPESELID